MEARVPDLFLSVATWLEGRPFGDPAGIAVRDVLLELTGPPRIGVCTVDAPVIINIEGAVMVHTRWPAVGSGADVVLLIHSGELSGRIRSRMRVGPQRFVQLRDRKQAENFRISATDLGEIRENLLDGELRALAVNLPELQELLPAARGPLHRRPRVAVIGPVADLVEEVAASLKPHVDVEHSADVDVVIAVAGPSGFSLIDAPLLQDAWQRVGRLVVTSPTPDGVCPHAVVAGDDVLGAVRRIASRPVGAALPEVPLSRWAQAVDRIEMSRRKEVERIRRSKDREALRAMAAQELPPEPRISTTVIAYVLATVILTCFLRIEFLPMVLIIALMHLRQMRVSVVTKWWEEACRVVLLDTTSHIQGPRAWVRQKWVESEKTR